MIKNGLCVRINVMRTFIDKKIKPYILTALIAVFILSAVGFISTGNSFAHAENIPPKAELYLPSSKLEYAELNQPIGAYSEGEVTAIVQKNDVFSIFYNETRTELGKNASLVKKLDQNTLLFNNGVIYAINLLNLSAEPSQFQGGIPTNSFDINQNYLITAINTTAYVYENKNSVYTKNDTFNITVVQDSPVAINENGDFFYVNSNQLQKRNVNNSNIDVVADGVSPTKMIANNDFVYYIENNKVYRVANQANSTPVELKVVQTEIDIKFELGKLETPSGISFRNGNLLITDETLDAVQEFKVTENNKLEFTGFAIASGKNAYNRASTDVIDVEKFGDSVATLDEKQLLINTPVSESKYSRENFKNFFKEDFKEEIMPNAFALGNGTALLSFKHNDSSGYLKLLNIQTGEISDKKTLFSGNTIKDVCYQSGYYYVYATSGTTDNKVFKINEKTFDEQEYLSLNDLGISKLTVDVFGNAYLANPDNGYIYFCKKSENFTTPNQITTLQGVSKMATDLSGKLYILAGGKLKTYDGTTLSEDIVLSTPDSSKTLKSFALNFDRKEVYFIFGGAEYVCVSTNLGNCSITDATVSDANFKITDATAQKEDLKIATVNADANVYSVTRNGESFNYNGLVQKESEYVFICDVPFGNNLTLCALAGTNGIVLVNKIELTIVAPTQGSVPQSAFITTDVHVYYLPIVTQEGVYSLFDGEYLALKKGEQIQPVCKVSVLGKDFYFVTATVNGKQVSGYVPVNFTAELLSEDFEWKEYKVVRLNKTQLFSDAQLSNEICDIKNGTKARLISSEDGILCIAIKLDGENFTLCYVSEKALDNSPSRAVRNILIILAATAAVCGSISYFLMRKRG